MKRADNVKNDCKFISYLPRTPLASDHQLLKIQYLKETKGMIRNCQSKEDMGVKGQFAIWIGKHSCF